MNKSLRQLFTIVVALFVILGMSTTIIMAIRANQLTNDARNVRALYHEYGAPRGSILAADGSVIAKSDPSNDSFSYQRSYSAGELYAPVTGFFSISQRGWSGVEASRSSLLSGQSEQLLWQRFGSTDGAAVAIEPKTGRILAMVSTPSYDPNQLASHDMSQANSNYGVLSQDATNPMLNRATSQLYPPGSTFKTVVAAAALETGQYQPDTQIPAGASYTLPGTVTQLTNAVPQADGADGKISMEDALAYSSNTAFAQLGVSLGDNAVSSMAKKLGFDSPITVDGSDYTGTPWVSVTSKFPTDINDDKLALASIGQGDTVVTPLQNAMVAAANDGKLMQPTLVDRVRSADLSVISQTKPTVMSHAFSADTANKLTQMMEAVVTKENTNLAINGVQVAVKTGTAQIGNGNTSIDGWVIGFAPADDPKIAVAVVVHNVDLYGSVAAGPIMKAMMQEALAE